MSEPIIQDSADGENDSSVGQVSVRGIISLMLVTTVCLLAFFGITVDEPLYSMATLALGFYFGQKGQK